MLVCAIAKHGWFDKDSRYNAAIANRTIEWGEPFNNLPSVEELNCAVGTQLEIKSPHLLTSCDSDYAKIGFDGLETIPNKKFDRGVANSIPTKSAENITSA